MGLGFLYNDTVTLYNKSIDKQTGEEHWFPTLIEGASLLFKSNTTVDKNGKKSADEAKLFVDTCTLQKPYAKPKEWNDMPDDQKAVSLWREIQWIQLFCNRDFTNGCGIIMIMCLKL